MSDARFEDGAEEPLALLAVDEADLSVMSSLVQDAVLTVNDMRFVAKRREFAVLLNRFRWEDVEAAKKRGRPVERVQSLLVVENVLGVASNGVDRRDPDLVLSLLSLEWHPGDDAAGELDLILAGDGAIRLRVEALEVALKDVTRPYVAPSRKMPGHDI